MKTPGRINFLYTNIGRGHPFYLDELQEQVRLRSNLSLAVDDVIAQSRGLSRLAWSAVKWLYHHSSSSSVGRRLYARLRRRSDPNGDSFGLKVLAGGLRNSRVGLDELLVVAHPILVGILKGRPGLIYQHGELVAPDESLVVGAGTVLVPTAEVARRFVGAGYDSGQVVTIGLGIESALTARAREDYLNRQSRLESDAPLNGLFLASGAEPAPHVAQIIAGVLSVVKIGGRTDVLVRRGGHLQSALKLTSLPDSVRIHLFSDRREEAELSTQLVPDADYLVAPSHERTNWAVGLGLPMLILTPTIGSFAPLNLALMVSHGVGEAISDVAAASDLGSRLTELHSTGELSRMSERGWGRYDIDGFGCGADALIRLAGSTAKFSSKG